MCVYPTAGRLPDIGKQEKRNTKEVCNMTAVDFTEIISLVMALLPLIFVIYIVKWIMAVFSDMGQ